MAQEKTTSKKTTKRKTNARSKTTRGGTSKRKTTPKRRTPAKRKTTKRKNMRDFRLELAQKALIVGIAVVFLTVILVLSLLSPTQGQLTTGLSSMMMQLFGWGGLIVPLVTGAIGFYLVLWGMEQPPTIPVYRVAGFALLFVSFETLASFTLVWMENEYFDFWAVAEAEKGGGYFGGAIAYVLQQGVGSAGTIFILLIIAILGAILISGVTREDMGLFLNHLFSKDELPATPAMPVNVARSKTAVSPSAQPALIPEAVAKEPKKTPKKVPIRKPSRGKKKETAVAEEQNTVVSPVFLGSNGQSYNAKWELPKIGDILESGTDSDPNGTIIREQVEIIEHTLESFGAPATVVEINQGPTITQFGVEPSFLEMRNGRRTKVKVGKIAGLADDLSLALHAQSIRIQAPVPGKGYIGIEVPNPAKALVSLRDVMETAEFDKVKAPLSIGLGQDVAGQPIVGDLAKMPHMLIAGATGSGKSVLVNGIIACLLLRNTPDQLKLVMVDPKRVELTGYNGIPHLSAPVVVEMDRVIGVLQWAMREMDNRYKMFANVGARNIIDYNKKTKRNKSSEPLPYIVIIIDELADLMMLSPEETERGITRLAQLARATGMHMVIATQRPSVDVVTGLIKANFPARVAFAVASSTDSRVILDATGAERLLGQGDMLFQAPDAPAPVRSQGCFVSDGELNKLIDYWRTARRFNMIPAEESIQREKSIQSKQKQAAIPVSAPPPKPPAAKQTAVDKSTPTVEAPVVNLSPAKVADDADAPTEVNTPAPKKGAKERSKKAPPKPQAKPAPVAPPEKTSQEQQPLWEALQEMESQPAQPKYEDALMVEAIALVRDLDKASTSLLQRRFRIGYTRAARMIDTMEDMGIIGPPTGTSKARTVTPWPDEANAETMIEDEE